MRRSPLQTQYRQTLPRALHDAFRSLQSAIVDAEPLAQHDPRPLECHIISRSRRRITRTTRSVPDGEGPVPLRLKRRQLLLHRSQFCPRAIEQRLRLIAFCLSRRDLRIDTSQLGSRRRQRCAISGDNHRAHG